MIDRRLRARIALVALAGASLWVAAVRVAAAPDPYAAYVAPVRLVDIGGRAMNLSCFGSGAPTVILDAGFGGSTIAWYRVQPSVAAFTKVCSFDRAGMGYSDPGPPPRTTAATVDDLHRLLVAAEVPSPYVLVGHSLGSFDVRLFADRYTSDVAGLVLVDPSHEDMIARLAAVSPRARDEVADLAAFVVRCRAAATKEAAHPGAPYPNSCVPGYEFFPTVAVENAMRRIAERPAMWIAMSSELENLETESAREMRAERRTFGTLPVVVLTALDNTLLESDSSTTTAHVRAVWMQLHDELASLSTCGRNDPVHAGHDIEMDRPALVAHAIRAVVDAARVRAAAEPGDSDRDACQRFETEP